MKKIRNQEGFTLVELLIVIVILGVLAAMVVPRMLRQTAAADTAEAIQMLGAIRRQAVSRIDAGTAVPAFDTSVSTAAGSAWETLGMGPLPANRKFNYVDAGPSTDATASLIGGTANETLTINYNTGLFTCGTDYDAITDSGGVNVIGCRA